MGPSITHFRRSAVLVCAIGALAILLPAASAAGATFCVHKPACVAAGGTDVPGPATGATIQNAYTLAADGDRIELGPVTFTGVNVTAAGDDVTLDGEGIGRTVLVEGPGAGGTALTWNNGRELSDFTVHLPDSGSTAINARDLVQRVAVTSEPGVTNATGVQTQPGGTFGTELEFSQVLLPVATGNVAVRLVSTARVRDSQLEGAIGVLSADEGPNRAVERVRISANRGVWAVGNGALFSFTVTSTLVRVVGAAGFGLAADATATTGANVNAGGLTITGDGTAGSAGVAVSSGNGPGATLQLRNSVIHNVPVPLSCSDSNAAGTPSSLNIDWSSYQQNITSCAGTGGGTVTHGPNNLNPPPDPRFVDLAGGDLHLRFDSPLIDRAQPGGAGGTDAFNGVRVRDGNGDGEARTDIGGAEYQRLPPTVTAGAPASGAAGSPLPFQATGSDPDPGDALAFRWSFDDGGPLLEGASVSRTAPAPRVLTGTVTATDPTGLTAGASAGVQVLDRTAPRITGLRMVPARFARGRLLPRVSRRARVGSSIRFRLSEAARVTLSYERILPGRRVGRRCLAPTRRRRARRRCSRFVAVRRRSSLSARSGARRIRFQGRLTRRSALKPGRYRLTLVAQDAAGNRSRATRANFTLLARR